MRFSVTVLVLAFVLPMLVQAQTLVYEDAGEPLFVVEFPPDWLVDTDFLDEARAAGNVDEAGPRLRILEAMPVDGSKLWLGFWVVPRVSTLSEAIDYLASLDAELFTDVERTPPAERTLNGMPAKSLTGTALRQGERVEFAAVLFEPRPQAVAMALYVGRPETWKRNSDALAAIRESLAPAGNRQSR
jgi:hypothetical protein